LRGKGGERTSVDKERAKCFALRAKPALTYAKMEGKGNSENGLKGSAGKKSRGGGAKPPTERFRIAHTASRTRFFHKNGRIKKEGSKKKEVQRD